MEEIIHATGRVTIHDNIIFLISHLSIYSLDFHVDLFLCSLNNHIQNIAHIAI
jgi:hypothetical protein